MDGFQFTKELCKQIAFFPALKHFRLRSSDTQSTRRKGSWKLGNL